MSWPTATDYNEAIQNPQVCFADAELRAGRPDGVMGLPQPFSGNFADVYKLLGHEDRNWAVKCFTREVQGLHARYQAISDHLQERSRPFMVEFQYLEEGIRVKGAWFPIVKMSWVEGFALNQFVADHAAEPGIIERLAELWLKLAVQLRDARMAHGDLQHGNVLLVPGSRANALALKLIDYDGMFVPALADRPSGELGHRNYQHPRRQDGSAYHREMDRFSNLAIYTALRGLRSAGGLWSKYGDAENLLFRQQDFAEPAGSTLLKEMWLLPDRDARALAGHLVLASVGPLDDVPLLSDLVSGGAVMPLEKGDESRIEGLLFMGTTVARRSGLHSRAGDAKPGSDPGGTDDVPAATRTTRPGTGADESRSDVAIPVLPSPLQPSDVRRRTPFPAGPVPETLPVLKAVPVPPPLPALSTPPPLPILVAVPVPPPLPAQAPEQSQSARSLRMPEMLPVPLPALRGIERSTLGEVLPMAVAVERAPTPFAPDDQRPVRRRSSKLDAEAKRAADDDAPNLFRDRPVLVWSSGGTLAVVLVGLLIWGLWPAKKASTATTPPPLPPPQLRPLANIDLIGGDSVFLTVQVDRRQNTGPLVLRTAGLPPGVAPPGDVVLGPDQEEVQLELTADPGVADGEHHVTVSLWFDNEKTDQSTISLNLHKRPMPRFKNLTPLVLKIGATRDVDFEVDRQGNLDRLSLEIVGLPRTVSYSVDPVDAIQLGPIDRLAPRGPYGPDEPKPGPPREIPVSTFIHVHFVVAKDAAPAEDFVTLRLLAGTFPAQELIVKYTLEKPLPHPQLLMERTLRLPQRDKTELKIAADRNGYAGPIELRIDNVPDGVECPDSAVIATGKTDIRLEFRTDGRAAEGVRRVVVLALVDGQVVDRVNLDLVFPKAPPPPPVDPDPPDDPRGTVSLRTADDVRLRGTFLPGVKGQRSKCVLLLHDYGQSRKEPNLARLATALNGQGFAVLAIDFRGHGDSTQVGSRFSKYVQNREVAVSLGQPGKVAGTISFKTFPPAYCVHLVDDVAAAKAFLDEKDRAGQVDAANLVVVGVGDGASIGTLWLAAESHRFRPADPDALVPGGKYAPVPEVRHVAGAVWIDFHVTIAGMDRTAAMAEWLRVAGKIHQTPMTFLYAAADPLSKRDATNAAAALRPGPRWTQAVPMPADAVGHELLDEGYPTEKSVLLMAKQMVSRTDGAIQLPRPYDGRSWWILGNNAVLARLPGDQPLQPVPVERLGVAR
jgi:pimeloyl-ACP methyl ester carboxylesterase